MHQNSGGVVWTNHILERMKERGLSQQDVLWVFNHPDKTIAATDQSAYRFYRNHKNLRIEVVAKKDNNQWIMVSCWTKPLLMRTPPSYQNKWSLLWRIPEFIIKTILGK